MKYRIKLSNSRVIGPFNLDEIIRLINNKKVSYSDYVQVFPEGVWERIDTIDIILEGIKNQPEQLNEDETYIINLKKSAAPDDQFTDSIIEPTLPADDIPAPAPIIETTRRTPTLQTTIVNENVNESEARYEKTKINPEYQRYLKKIKVEKEKKEKEKARLENQKDDIEIEEIKPDFENDSTEMISLSELKGDLISAIDTEEELEEDLVYRAKEKQKLHDAKKDKLILEDEREENDDDEPDNSLRKKIIVALIVIGAVFLFLDDSDISEKRPTDSMELKPPDISFPIRYEQPNPERAKDLYKKGLLRLSDPTYTAKLEAIKFFFDSTKEEFEENPAMAQLIFNYSDVLENSDEYIEDSNTIFKLTQIFNNMIFKDPSFATAIGYFYYKVDKFQASLRIFDKYLTLNPKKVSAELFCVRLLVLMRTASLETAKKMALRLEQEKNKSMFVLRTLVEFYKFVQNPKRLVALIEEGEKLFPTTIYFKLEMGGVYAEQGKMDLLEKKLIEIQQIGVEGSKTYYARFLTLKGFFFAAKSETIKAATYFKQSLALADSIDLIEKLSLLDGAEDKEVDLLIQNSKAKKYMRKSNEYLNERDITSALKMALNASTASPEMIEPKLNLAKLQIKRGYIQDAIDSLEELYNKRGLTKFIKAHVLYDLIDAYIHAFKFEKVNELIAIAVNTTGSNSFKFFKAKAAYFLAKGQYNVAAKWLQQAINANPIDDNNVYDLAKLYIKYHKYQPAKNILKRAMDLDPANVLYKVSFAKIIYEVENADAAIAYLYNVLEDFPDDPILLGAIGIYYYKSGQIKNYQQVKKKLMELPKKDRSLYEFLIESARLDDDKDKVVNYSESLLDIDPGDLETRMNLAELYIGLQKYKNAKFHLEEVEKRLATYPRLNYLYAKLYYLIDDFDKAKPLAEKEIKENPSVVDGYILLGDIYIKKKDLMAARAEYIKAIQIDRKNINAILGIAFVAASNNQYDMAIDQYKKAIEIDLNYSLPYKLLGDLYRKVGRGQDAIIEYKKYLELEPNSEHKNKIETYIRLIE